MIRIFHPNHGYLLVTDEQEKKRLLESGGYVSENFYKKQDEPAKVIDEPITKTRGRPKKWQ